MADNIDIDLMNRRAIQYARWLAERDGIRIPDDCAAEALWGNQQHVRSVMFFFDGVDIEIEIPNWDWQPDKEAA